MKFKIGPSSGNSRAIIRFGNDLGTGVWLTAKNLRGFKWRPDCSFARLWLVDISWLTPVFSPLKKTLSALSVGIALCGLLTVAITGCGTTPTQAAVGVETVTVPTVDAAMGTWAKYCYATNATAQQINDVSNAYTAYVNSQVIASNVLVYAASATNSSVNVSNILNAATASQGALLNIITLYTTK